MEINYQEETKMESSLQQLMQDRHDHAVANALSLTVEQVKAVNRFEEWADEDGFEVEIDGRDVHVEMRYDGFYYSATVPPSGIAI